MNLGKCPICRKPAQAANRPFCSERCAYLDLSKWLGGGYRIPTEEAPIVYEGNPGGTEEEES